jgi:hypothetical protein
LAAPQVLAENYLLRAHYGNSSSIPALAGQQKAPQKGVPPLGSIHLLFAFGANSISHLFVYNRLNGLSIRRNSQISTDFHFLSPIESTRAFEVSGQNGRFLPQNRPFLQENRAIFSRFHVRVPHISRRFLPGDVGNLELSGPQQIPPRPKGICPTFGQKSPAGGPAK